MVHALLATNAQHCKVPFVCLLGHCLKQFLVKLCFDRRLRRAKVREVSIKMWSLKVVRSLDNTFGLDQEAIKAAKQWRFRPGTRLGEPVPVLITIELAFTLR